MALKLRRYAAKELGCARGLRDATNASVPVCDDDARVTLVAKCGASVVDVEVDLSVVDEVVIVETTV